MTHDTRDLPVRLAIRKEGEFVNAYLAQADTMEGARLLGSIDIGIAQRPIFFERWKALMNDVLSVAVEEAFGQTPELSERRAPEHERSGSA